MKLARYQDFLDRVDELGFMALGCQAFPALFEEAEHGWEDTDDPETNPWRWKDRAAEEKALAYGNILGGQRGFVSARMYPPFYTAYNPAEPIEELWASGLVSQTTWHLWQLLEAKTSLSTDEIRREMDVTRKKGGSRVDASLKELQRTYYITVVGSKSKTDKQGKPYGWPSCVYGTVTSWVPADWMSGISNINPEEARESILDTGMAMGRFSGREELARALGLLKK